MGGIDLVVKENLQHSVSRKGEMITRMACYA